HDRRPVRGNAGAVGAPAARARPVVAWFRGRPAVPVAAVEESDPAHRRAQGQGPRLVHARRRDREILHVAAGRHHSGQLSGGEGTMNGPTKAATAAMHLLRSGPNTVHWGFFDGSLAPVLEIDTGERVTIECVSGNPEWMPDAASGFEVLPELREIHQKIKRGTGNHILTGPIFVRGAQVGDVLE